MRITLPTLELSQEAINMGLTKGDFWEESPEEIDLLDIERYRRKMIETSEGTKQVTRLHLYSGSEVIVNMKFLEFQELYYEHVTVEEEEQEEEPSEEN